MEEVQTNVIDSYNKLLEEYKLKKKAFLEVEDRLKCITRRNPDLLNGQGDLGSEFGFNRSRSQRLGSRDKYKRGGIYKHRSRSGDPLNKLKGFGGPSYDDGSHGREFALDHCGGSEGIAPYLFHYKKQMPMLPHSSPKPYRNKQDKDEESHPFDVGSSDKVEQNAKKS